MKSMLSEQPLRFWHRGQTVNLGNVPPDRTLLDLLREDLRLTATKEGCSDSIDFIGETGVVGMAVSPQI